MSTHGILGKIIFWLMKRELIMISFMMKLAEYYKVVMRWDGKRVTAVPHDDSWWVSPIICTSDGKSSRACARCIWCLPVRVKPRYWQSSISSLHQKEPAKQPTNQSSHVYLIWKWNTHWNMHFNGKKKKKKVVPKNLGRHLMKQNFITLFKCRQV